jgi:thiosulfate dehydrogenase (quinone) large subunit
MATPTRRTSARSAPPTAKSMPKATTKATPKATPKATAGRNPRTEPAAGRTTARAAGPSATPPPGRSTPRAFPAEAAARLRTDPRWILLPLRGYLAFTFLYAGLSKIADRRFLDKSDPTSMYATLVAVKAQSPIGGLLGPVQDHAFAFGLLMAFGEIAVGLGMLLGLFARVAALGGMAISLSLFLTVSWNATPWYTGADIVYFFALTPILLGGAGPLSADGWLAAVHARRGGRGADADDRTRRVLLGGLAGFAGLIAVGGAALARGSKPGSKRGDGTAGTGTGALPEQPAGTGAGAGPSVSATGSASGTAQTAQSPTGPVIVAASAVPVGGAVQATDPKTGDPIYVLQLEPGRFTALDSTCPHQGCAVSFVSGSSGFICPCHESTFDAGGGLTRGPATTGLTQVPVAKSGDRIVRT